MPVTRRSVLSGIGGITLGAVLPAGRGAAAVPEEYEDVPESASLTPRPTGTGDGGVRSLNGTWDFTLSRSTTPPSAESSKVVTPDRSPRGNDGTLVSDPPVVRDSAERAVDLSGESRVAVGDADALDFTSPGFTVEATFRYSEDTILFSKGNSQYSAGVYGGELSFWTEGEGEWPSVGGGDLTPGRWYTATFVVDESEIRIYVDGRRVASGDHGFSSLPHADSPVHLGYNSGDGTRGNPVVDSFRAFDTALSDGDVAAGFSSVPADARAWLSFDSASGGTVADESSAGNDGTLVGDPSFVSGRDGRGLDLSGDGYVSAGSDDSLDFTSPGFTLRTTLRYDGGSGVVLDRGSSSVSGGTEQFGLGVYDGTVSFYAQTAEGSYPDDVQADISTGAWHDVTVVAGDSEIRLYLDGELADSTAHDAAGFASSDAAFVVGGGSLDVAVKSTAAFGAALSAEQIRARPGPVSDSAVLWLTYDTIEDRSVEWREESVPGQWAYDGYFVPDGASEWYPPEGELGWYRREFEVPDGWEGTRLKLRFDAVYSHARVYVNGTQVTEHVGGYTPFEADVTDAVDIDGANTLAVAVSQRSKADDMGWQNVTGGITRGVSLLSVPEAHLAECDVRTTLDGDAATVSVATAVTNAGRNALDSATVTATLIDPEGSTVATARRTVSSLSAGDSEGVTVDLDVRDPETWNPERPRLYELGLELDAGEATERIGERVGIREVEVDGTDLLLNGESVTLRGVNWEEIHLPKHGHAVPPAVTREDARRLKEANVNYVRTAHHPTSEAFLDACDELGIVVEVEAPHMFVGRHRGDPHPDVVVRQTAEMVERDKNRPSVCVWSIANESDWFDCFETAARLVREIDPTRPTVFNHDEYDAADPWHDDYDLRAHHYPALRTGSTVEDHAGLSDPVLFDEYAHTYCYNDRELVTDPGLRDEWGRTFETIWELCREADSVAGAALWAGGDHLEQWGEYLWGILDRNRRRRPEFWHVKKAYAPVRFGDVEWRGRRVTLTVENRHEFVDLSERRITWDNGVESGDLSMDLAPGERTELSFAVPGDRLELEVTHPEGYTINEFVAIPDARASTLPSNASETAAEASGKSRADDGGPLSIRTSDDGSVEIRASDGTVLAEDPELVVTPTQGATGRDYDSAIDHRPSGRTVTDVTRDGSVVTVAVEYDVAEGTFTLREDGDEGALEVEYEFTLSESVDVREVGVALPAPSAFETLSWERDALWSVYPDDHVGRPNGSATAFPNGARPENEGIELRSDGAWKDDTTVRGSNDFRSTKRNVRVADLTDGSDTGVRVRAEGDRHVRAQVRTDCVDLLVLDRSVSGTNADDWLDRKRILDQNPTLESGETLRGTVTLRAVPDEGR